MTDYLYHGSGVAGISKLKACSLLHGTDKKVVYLTDNIPYALLYIWDEKHIGCREKYVTGGIKNGIVYYQEQFPGQLAAFYKGISGYLYCIPRTSDVRTVENRESMYYRPGETEIDHVVPVPNVYEELLKYESAGVFKVQRFDEQPEDRQNELTDMIAGIIAESDFFNNEEEKAQFYKKYFTRAWERVYTWSEQCEK